MASSQSDNGELLRLVNDLRRARRTLIEAVQALPPRALDERPEGSAWTARRLIEYCRAVERWHMSRMYSFFDPEIKLYDSPAASLDRDDPVSGDLAPARECAEIWLAGRETEMWLDLIEEQSLDAVRRASPAWPQGGWTIREVFEKVTATYRERTRALAPPGA